MKYAMQSKGGTILAGVLGLSLALATATPAFTATTWTVTSAGDDGTAGTLRYALDNAQSGDTIQFSLPNPSTIVLTNGRLSVNKNLTITGPGAAQLAISGNHTSRAFTIGANVAISGVTIEDGFDVGGADLTSGGGIYIYNSRTLTLTNCTVSGNTESGITFGMPEEDPGGGGIYNDGTLTLMNSIVSGNQETSTMDVSRNGIADAGIYNRGTLTLVNSAVSGNTAILGGSGIGNLGYATLINSTVSGNTTGINGDAEGLDGAGIASYFGTLTMINSTVSGNTNWAGSGGIGNFFGSLTLSNSTISGNTGHGLLIEGSRGERQRDRHALDQRHAAGQQWPKLLLQWRNGCHFAGLQLVG